ncbi:MAG: hypothetical protein WC343_15415 [Bacilli bacterium]|jgi:hypothetical protein
MVTGNATDLAAVLAALNETGGLPISVNMIAEQNAGQFWITVGLTLFGSLFLLISNGQGGPLRPLGEELPATRPVHFRPAGVIL